VLVTTRQTRDEWHALAASIICGHKSCARYDISSVFPLYLYPDPSTNGDLFSNGSQRHVNLNTDFIADVESKTGLRFKADGLGDLKLDYGPDDIFNYIYAVLHSPTYRKRYAHLLKIDFPRVPLTRDAALFRALCGFGHDLVSLHLLQSSLLDQEMVSFPVADANSVEAPYPQYYPPGERVPDSAAPLKAGRVHINKRQYFEGVSPEIWSFNIGGYQVCAKWLKDRQGRDLTYDDCSQYARIVGALHHTIRIMCEIDTAIGAWPMHS